MSIALAANLNTLFEAHVPWAARCARAAAAGFAFAELLTPYDAPAKYYRQWLDAAGLQAILINTPAGDHFGWAAIDGAQAQFRQSFDQAVRVAQTLDATKIHVMAGRASADVSVSLSTLLENLSYALRQIEGTDLVLTLEALNRSDVPGYFYHHPQDVLTVLAALPSTQLGQQFDLYHTQREGLDVLAQLQVCRAGLAHVQIAQAPARCEPDLRAGVLRQAVQCLVAWGYAGYLGCEYKPQENFETGLAWLKHDTGLLCLGKPDA